MPVNLATLEAEKLEKRIRALELQMSELRRAVARIAAVASSKGDA